MTRPPHLTGFVAPCPTHGDQRFGHDEQREWWICPACVRAGALPFSVVFDEDLARNPDGGDVTTLDP